MPVASLADLQTPALLLDETTLDANINRMRNRFSAFGVPLRPHIKTAKSAAVYARALDGAVGVTVSTLAEAEYAFENGVRNILYAVGIAPVKLERAAALMRRGADLTLTVDNLDAARALAAKGAGSALIFRLSSRSTATITAPASSPCPGRRARSPAF